MKHLREIFSIALPAIVSNITTPILSLVDVAITGHFGDAVYLGAIAVGSTMFNMLYWLCGFLRMGTSGLAAQAFGASDEKMKAVVFYRALALGLFLGIILILVGGFAGNVILGFMDAEDSVQQLALSYFGICIWGAPAVLCTFGLSGWLLGMQNSAIPMWMAIVTNVVNIPVSLALVFGLGWKIEGVATGTLVAQWVGVALGLAIGLVKYRPVFPGFRALVDKSGLIKFFKINADIFMRTLCLVAVTLWFTHSGAKSGVDVLAANALLLQLFMLFSYFMDGFAFSGEALSGKYLGMSQKDKLLGVVKELLATGLLCAALFSLIYAFGGKWIIGILSDQGEIIDLAGNYIWWVAGLPLCGFAAFVWDGVFIGITRTRALLASMAGAMIVFFAVYFSAVNNMGNHGLWLAFDLYLLTRGLILGYIFKSSHTWR